MTIVRRALLAALALLWGCAPPAFAGTASEGFVPGGSGQPVDFDEVSRCEGGSEPGSLCSTSGDCAGGGTCVTAWTQTSAPLVPSFCATRTEQRSVGTSAVDAFSSATEPACSVRVRNIGATTLYVGWSGVTTSSGVPLYPGEERAMYPPDRRGTAVKIIGDASGGLAAVVTP